MITFPRSTEFPSLSDLTRLAEHRISPKGIKDQVVDSHAEQLAAHMLTVMGKAVKAWGVGGTSPLTCVLEDGRFHAHGRIELQNTQGQRPWDEGFEIWCRPYSAVSQAHRRDEFETLLSDSLTQHLKRMLPSELDISTQAKSVNRDRSWHSHHVSVTFSWPAPHTLLSSGG